MILQQYTAVFCSLYLPCRCLSLSSPRLQSVVQQPPTKLRGTDSVDDEITGIHRRNLLFQAISAVALTSTAQSTSAAPDSISPEADNRRILLFERTAPSVVFIDTFVERQDYFSTNVMEVPLGSGSGFVWDNDGHIVTNYHVVQNARTAQVTILTKSTRKSNNPSDVVVSNGVNPLTPLSNSSEKGGTIANYKRSVYKATVMGSDPSKDIAVLKVDADKADLYPISVGSSSDLRVGQSTLAIGNPFGLDHTLTAGIISGTGREVRSPTGQPISNVIQTDAAINPGNSGGPLLDGSGRLIGMNTAIYSPSGGSAGIGFAIPVDTVKYVVSTLIREGKIVRPILGISYLQSKQAQALGIQRGVLILDIPEGSPAAKAGLKGTRRTDTGLVQIGDVIVKVANMDINTEADLFKGLEKYKPGDSVHVVVCRFEPKGEAFVARNIEVDIELQSSESIPRMLKQVTAD